MQCWRMKPLWFGQRYFPQIKQFVYFLCIQIFVVYISNLRGFDFFLKLFIYKGITTYLRFKFLCNWIFKYFTAYVYCTLWETDKKLYWEIFTGLLGHETYSQLLSASITYVSSWRKDFSFNKEYRRWDDQNPFHHFQGIIHLWMYWI